MPLLKTERLTATHKVKALVPQIEARLAKLRNACPAFDHAANTTKAQQDLQSAKGESEIRDATTRLMLLISQETAALRVQQVFVIREDVERRKIWNDEARLIYAGLSEVEVGLKERLAQVEAEDVERGQQIGGTVTSHEMLQAVKTRLENVRTGRGHLDRGEAMEARGCLGQASEISLG